MNIIGIFGGGRWSRVILSVLLKEFPELDSIVWFTKNGYIENIAWLENKNITKIKIIQNEALMWARKPQAVIIATSSHLHKKYTHEALIRKIPVLSEKPFCFSTTEAQELIFLSQQLNVAVGVNFEFRYASYLHDFYKHLNTLAIHSIDIIWQDSFCETRYGEKKVGDIYTPLMYDSFQHCWSLLNFLLPNEPLRIFSVTYNEDTSVFIEAQTLNKRITITLSRRATQRDRIISVNNGVMALDFSLEPGLMTIHGKVIQNNWIGNRPLLAVFNSFFEVIKKPELLHKWPLYISNCLDVVHLSAEASLLLEQSQQRYLENKRPLLAQDTVTRNLLIDIFLPKLASTGEYHRAHNLQEQIAFSEYIIERFATNSIQKSIK